MDEYVFVEEKLRHVEDATFPFKDFSPVPGFIHPYLFNDEIHSVNEYEYPEGYNEEECYNEPISGGGLGGSDALWNVSTPIMTWASNS